MADPTPEEIAERCLEIQAEWSPEQRLKRMRVDWRPKYRGVDGERIDMDGDVYEEHLETRHEVS